MKFIIIYCLIISCFPISMYSLTKSKLLVDNDIAHAKPISVENIKKNLFEISGSDMEGRATGTLGERKAANYIISQFEHAGIKPYKNSNWRQCFPLSQDSVCQGIITCQKSSYHYGSDFYYWGEDGPIDIDASMNSFVFAGYGICTPTYNSYRNIDVQGKIVLVFHGEPRNNDSTYAITGTMHESQWSTYFLQKIKTAAEKGAKAILIIYDYGKFGDSTLKSRSKKYFSVNRNCKGLSGAYIISSKMASEITGISISDLRKRLVNESVSMPPINKPIQIKFKRVKVENVYACNIFAVIEGSEKKDEFVFLTAHYDHLGKSKKGVIRFGADDNASGVSVLLEIARTFAEAKRANMGPKRTIVLMAFTGEENGLWGSSFYINSPVFPLNKISAVLNMDMIGRIDDKYKNDKDSVNYIYTVGDNEISSDLTPILEIVNEKYIHIKMDKTYNLPENNRRKLRASDQYSFFKRNIPIIFFSDGYAQSKKSDYHTPMDTPDKVNCELLAKRARLILYTTVEIANSENKLKIDRNVNSVELFDKMD